MSLDDLTLGDALKATKSAALSFPLGRCIKWTLWAGAGVLSVSALVLLGAGLNNLAHTDPASGRVIGKGLAFGLILGVVPAGIFFLRWLQRRDTGAAQ